MRRTELNVATLAYAAKKNGQLMRLGALTLLGGASFLLVKRVLNERRKQRFEISDRPKGK